MLHLWAASSEHTYLREYLEALVINEPECLQYFQRQTLAYTHPIDLSTASRLLGIEMVS